MSVKKEVKHIKVDVSKFTKEQLEYIDFERMDETLTRFIFPTLAKGEAKVLDDDMMKDIYYKFIAKFLQYQYKLPVKYLEPDIDSCSYISQKTPLEDNDKNITSASITIEPLNQNVFKQISYTPINQAFDIGIVVSLHENINYINEDGSTPNRGLLTSASLVCNKLTKKEFSKDGKKYDCSKYAGLCNRCIPYSSIDIGSEIIGKFIIKTTNLRESMALYRFRRPADNILEIITPDYLNVSCDYVIDLTLSEMNKDKVEYIKEFTDIINEMKKI